MRAMLLRKFVSLDETRNPLDLVDLPTPEPRSDEVLIRVSVCGVCHTELDEIEGRTAPPILPIVPGHQVIGRIDAVGDAVTTLRPGQRVGVGWIHSSSGGQDENLSPRFRATGCDANGGYAEFMTVGENYAYPIPAMFSDAEAAPLLCAGAVGYRALKLANLNDGDLLGLTGFGGSALLVLQTAQHLYPGTKLFVFARDPAARRFALDMGATWAGDQHEFAPEKLHAVIDTTPAWKPVVEALGNLRPGGRLVINAIRKEDADKDHLLKLDYQEHLWLEREIKSVANVTHRDIAEFLTLAAAVPLKPVVEPYPFEDANRALFELKHNPIRGSKVLVVDPSTTGDTLKSLR